MMIVGFALRKLMTGSPEMRLISWGWDAGLFVCMKFARGSPDDSLLGS